MGLFSSKKTRRLQLFHHDNGDLEFVWRDIIGQSATELDNTGSPKRSWIDYFQTLYPFNGYKGIPSSAVQLAYDRHFHLEIHDILPKEQRPPDDGSMDNVFISTIADTRAIQLSKAPKPRTIYHTLTLILGAALFVELIIWGISYATR